MLIRKNGDVVDLGGKEAVDAVPGVREAKLFSPFDRLIASSLAEPKNCIYVLVYSHFIAIAFSMVINKGISCSFQDMFHLETPGGGGYGSPDCVDDATGPPPTKRLHMSTMPSGSLENYRMMQESA